MMVSERIFPPLPPETPPPEPATVRVTLELTGPAYPCAVAVMTVEPALTAVARPEVLTVATEGSVELHATAPVMFCVEG
jgi:hypothetical protein